MHLLHPLPRQPSIHPSIHSSIHSSPNHPIKHNPHQSNKQTLRATLPLHIVLGALTGCALADDRFARPGSQPWYKAIFFPVLIHGLFDFVIPLAAVSRSTPLVYFLSVAIVAAATALTRWRFLQVLALLPPPAQPVDIHAQIKAGQLTPPSTRRVVLTALAALCVCVAFLLFVLPLALHAVVRATGGGGKVTGA